VLTGVSGFRWRKLLAWSAQFNRYEHRSNIMAFSEIEIQRIKKIVGGFCTQKTRPDLKDKLRYDYILEKQSVFIREIRPMWNNPDEFTKLPFVKMTWVKSQKVWKLYWQRANGKWVQYEEFPQSRDLDEIIQAIDDDVYHCFFG